jgi:hypothetical protein
MTHEPIAKCANVEDTKYYTWTVKISESGGKVVAEWSGPETFEPNYAHLALYLKQERVAWHALGKASGSHIFKETAGADYRLALAARDFQNQDVDFVTTGFTTTRERELEAEKTYKFRSAVGRNDQNAAQLTWESDAAFRPRQSKAILSVQGEGPRDYWIETANRSFDTGVRWGVGLSGAYTAEDYAGVTRVVVDSGTTKNAQT